MTTLAVYHTDVSELDPQSGSFEELAMPLFDPLYNFAHWLTRNRDEAEDLVQETYFEDLKGFSSFQLGINFRAMDVSHLAQPVLDLVRWIKSGNDTTS